MAQNFDSLSADDAQQIIDSYKPIAEHLSALAAFQPTPEAELTDKEKEAGVRTDGLITSEALQFLFENGYAELAAFNDAQPTEEQLSPAELRGFIVSDISDLLMTASVGFLLTYIESPRTIVDHINERFEDANATVAVVDELKARLDDAFDASAEVLGAYRQREREAATE